MNNLFYTGFKKEIEKIAREKHRIRGAITGGIIGASAGAVGAHIGDPQEAKEMKELIQRARRLPKGEVPVSRYIKETGSILKRFGKKARNPMLLGAGIVGAIGALRG